MAGARLFADLMPAAKRRWKREDVAFGREGGVVLAKVSKTICKKKEKPVAEKDWRTEEAMALEGRLIGALGAAGVVAKAEGDGLTLLQVLGAAWARAAVQKLREDPFAGTEGGLAELLVAKLQHTRPDLLTLPWRTAVERLEETYSGWIDSVVKGASRPAEGSAREVLARKAAELQKRDPDLTDAQAYDRATTDDPALARRALDEEG